MITVLAILVVGYFLYRSFFSRPSNSYGMGHGYGGGMGSLFTGMILGYLLDHYLINQAQFDLWQNLGMDELKDRLTSEGILSDSDFDSLASQASEGQLSADDNQQLGDNGWGNNESAGFDDSNGFDDFNDDGGFGGSDF